MKKAILTLVITLFSVISLNAQTNGAKVSIDKKESGKTEKPRLSKNRSTENIEIATEKSLLNYKAMEKNQNDAIITNLKKELSENSKRKDTILFFDEKTKKSILDSIYKLEKKSKQFQLKFDTLNFLYTKYELGHKCLYFIKLKSIRSRAFFDLFYGDKNNEFKALGNSGINFGSNTASIYSELVSGNLGLFRVSLGTLISSNSYDSLQVGKKEEAYQRLATYGGNTVLKFEYPIVYFHTKNQLYHFVSRLVVKGTSDLPVFGKSTEKWAGSGSMGIDIYGDASLSNDQLNFFFNFNLNKICGTDVYRDNLGIANSNFSFGQLSIGLIFLNNFKISFILTTFSSEESLRNKNIVAGGQVLR